MLSRPGEFNPNNYGISLLPAMMSDYAKKKKKKKKNFRRESKASCRHEEKPCEEKPLLAASPRDSTGGPCGPPDFR
jgi:hypothetical protein